MTENFKILAEFIKDISSETPNVESYIYVFKTHNLIIFTMLINYN